MRNAPSSPTHTKSSHVRTKQSNSSMPDSLHRSKKRPVYLESSSGRSVRPLSPNSHVRSDEKHRNISTKNQRTDDKVGLETSRNIFYSMIIFETSHIPTTD